MKNKRELTNELFCPIKYLVEVFGGKWKLPVICILHNGNPMRFSEIKRQLENVTDIMLSQTLKELEKSGIVTRHQYNEVPPRVDYTLTDKGKSILPLLTEMAQWAIASMQTDKIYAKCGSCTSLKRGDKK